MGVDASSRSFITFDIPHVCTLVHRLREQGIILDPFPVTLEEAEAALRDTVTQWQRDKMTESDKVAR